MSCYKGISFFYLFGDKVTGGGSYVYRNSGHMPMGLIPLHKIHVDQRPNPVPLSYLNNYP